MSVEQIVDAFERNVDFFDGSFQQKTKHQVFQQLGRFSKFIKTPEKCTITRFSRDDRKKHYFRSDYETIHFFAELTNINNARFEFEVCFQQRQHNMDCNEPQCLGRCLRENCQLKTLNEVTWNVRHRNMLARIVRETRVNTIQELYKAFDDFICDFQFKREPVRIRHLVPIDCNSFRMNTDPNGLLMRISNSVPIDWDSMTHPSKIKLNLADFESYAFQN